MEQDLASLLGTVQHNLPELEQKLAMGALEAVISDIRVGVEKRNSLSPPPPFFLITTYVAYLDLIADDSKRGKFKLEHFTLADYMRLDASAFRALNIHIVSYHTRG